MNVILATLLNTLWQAAAVALLAWAALRWTPQANAATREAVWWAVLAFVVLLPVLRLLPEERAVPRGNGGAAVFVAQPAMAFARPSSAFAAAPAPRPATARFVFRSRIWPRVLLALWCIFSLLQCARLLCSYRYLRRLKQLGQPASREFQTRFDACISTCAILRPVRLLISGAVPMPVAIGFRHPAVVLPEGLSGELTEAELDHVLLHELAHIARRDDWTNLAARLAGAFLTPHPVAAWVLRRIDRERELACDDWVVAATGAPRPYAASLARLFELCATRRPVLLASGIADGGSQLGDRIATLLRRGPEFIPRASPLRASVCAAAMLLLIIASARTPAWVAFAQSPAPVPARHPLPAPPHNSLLAALVANGYGDISVDDIIALKTQGVSADFLDGMGRAGIGKLQPRELIDLKVHGIRPEYIGDIRTLGFGPFATREYIDLKVHGVPIDLFRALQEAGFVHATAREIIDANSRGLRTPHLREARKYGSSLTLQQIVRLKQAGVL